MEARKQPRKRAFANARRLPEAIAEYESALRINPNYADTHFNLGNALSQILS